MSVSNVPLDGDVVKRAADHDVDSPQAELARFQLLKLKLEARAAADKSEVKELLGNVSEVDEISFDILKMINIYKESTPEFAQLVALTGTRDKFKMSRWLAERIYDQQRSEAIMAMYTPDKSNTRDKFYKNTMKGLEARAKKVDAATARIASKKSMAARLAAAASSATGVGSGGE